MVQEECRSSSLRLTQGQCRYKCVFLICLLFQRSSVCSVLMPKGSMFTHPRQVCPCDRAKQLWQAAASTASRG